MKSLLEGQREYQGTIFMLFYPGILVFHASVDKKRNYGMRKREILNRQRTSGKGWGWMSLENIYGDIFLYRITEWNIIIINHSKTLSSLEILGTVVNNNDRNIVMKITNNCSKNLVIFKLRAGYCTKLSVSFLLMITTNPQR